MAHLDPLPWEADPQFREHFPQKMRVSLVTSQASGCRYGQTHMANLSSLERASDEKSRAVREFPTSPLFSPAVRSAGKHAGGGA